MMMPLPDDINVTGWHFLGTSSLTRSALKSPFEGGFSPLPACWPVAEKHPAGRGGGLTSLNEEDRWCEKDQNRNGKKNGDIKTIESLEI